MRGEGGGKVGRDGRNLCANVKAGREIERDRVGSDDRANEERVEQTDEGRVRRKRGCGWSDRMREMGGERCSKRTPGVKKMSQSQKWNRAWGEAESDDRAWRFESEEALEVLNEEARTKELEERDGVLKWNQ